MTTITTHMQDRLFVPKGELEGTDSFTHYILDPAMDAHSDDLAMLEFTQLRVDLQLWWDGFRVGANFYAFQHEVVGGYVFVGGDATAEEAFGVKTVPGGYNRDAFSTYAMIGGNDKVLEFVSRYYLSGASMYTKDLPEMGRAKFCVGILDGLVASGRLKKEVK